MDIVRWIVSPSGRTRTSVDEMSGELRLSIAVTIFFTEKACVSEKERLRVVVDPSSEPETSIGAGTSTSMLLGGRDAVLWWPFTNDDFGLSSSATRGFMSSQGDSMTATMARTGTEAFKDGDAVEFSSNSERSPDPKPVKRDFMRSMSMPCAFLYDGLFIGDTIEVCCSSTLMSRSPGRLIGSHARAAGDDARAFCDLRLLLGLLCHACCGLVSLKKTKRCWSMGSYRR